MYIYTVYYDYQKDDGTWVYNRYYVTKFHRKGMHDRAARELEEYVGSFNNFRINTITCD